MSSKRAVRRKAERKCQKKQRFPDQTAAVAALISISKKAPAEKLRSYKCPCCRAWHIGHPLFGGHARRRTRRREFL